MMNSDKVHFIGEPIEVGFNQLPFLARKPHCPDQFTWNGETFSVVQLLSEWRDYSRRGDKRHNMRPANQRKAQSRGSFGVGKYYFRVVTNTARQFELYYDRSLANKDGSGGWILYKELHPD